MCNVPYLSRLCSDWSWHCQSAAGMCLTAPAAATLQLLPAVLPALVALFERTALPGCLDVLGDMVEIHFQVGEGGVDDWDMAWL